MAPIGVQDRGQYGEPGGEGIAAMLSDVLNLVIVRAVDVKTVIGHCRFS